MPTSKLLAASAFVIGLCSCADVKMLMSSKDDPVVKAQVSGYVDERFQDVLESRPTLNFITTTNAEIRYRSENQSVVSDCMEAAGLLGFKIVRDQKNCKDCLDTLIVHKFERNVTEGGLTTSCSSYFGASYGGTNCYSYRPVYSFNNRWVGLTFVNPTDKVTLYQADAYSTGAVASVVQVAKEMCFAALSQFPKRVENKIVRVTWDLVKERSLASEK